MSRRRAFVRSGVAMNYALGRYVFGLAVIASGICTLAWHQFSNVPPYPALETARTTLAYAVGAIQIIAGAALFWPRTARAGAIALAALYIIFALSITPAIAKHPLVYNGYGNVFEQLSYVAAALILYAASVPAPPHATTLARIGYYGFGLCVLSFGLEQLFYLDPTAGLVPKWIPPNQMFWATATTAAFVLAAIGLLTGFWSRLAAALTAAMVAGFGALVWVPILFEDPRGFPNWSEGTETLAIAAAAWIVAGYASKKPKPSLS